MPQYDIQVHKTAKKELESLAEHHYRRVTSVIEAIAQTEEISSHPKVSPLKGQDVCKARIGEYRILLKLEKPTLKVLKIEPRSTVYRNVDEFLNRVG